MNMSQRPQNQPKDYCRSGRHPLVEGNVRRDQKGHRKCLPCEREKNRERHRGRSAAGRREEFQRQHAGHDIRTDSNGRCVWCHTCRSGELDVDEVAVWRIMTGEAPAEASRAERDAAAYELWTRGVQVTTIAERAGWNGGYAREKLRVFEAGDGPDPYWRGTVFWAMVEQSRGFASISHAC